MPDQTRVLVWGENVHERKNVIVRQIYPNGIQARAALGLQFGPSVRVRDRSLLRARAHRKYGEPFAIPAPDEIVFLSWFEGGEVFRSGCTWKRGNGKIFYFRPGHETYPVDSHPVVRQVVRNAVRWAAPEGQPWIDSCPNIPVEQAREKLVAKGPRLHREGEAGFR